MTLHSEIFEQPERIRALLGSQKKAVQAAAKALQKREISYVFLAARGTSDNAGRYANYLWGGRNRLPLALATPSLFTYYQQPPNLKSALVVGVSQSGQSPDIISVLEEGRRQGCPTLAITNETDSPLAQAAEFVLDIQAGPEMAVAATKTYTAELMIIAMLSAAMNRDAEAWKELGQVGRWMREALKQEPGVKAAAQRYRYMRQCVVLGRGYNYATAFEWALKLKRIDLRGSGAVFLSGFPTWADRHGGTRLSGDGGSAKGASPPAHAGNDGSSAKRLPCGAAGDLECAARRSRWDRSLFPYRRMCRSGFRRLSVSSRRNCWLIISPL